MKARLLHVERDFGHNIQCNRPIVDVEITENIRTPTGWNEYQKWTSAALVSLSVIRWQLVGWCGFDRTFLGSC